MLTTCSNGVNISQCYHKLSVLLRHYNPHSPVFWPLIQKQLLSTDTCYHFQVQVKYDFLCPTANLMWFVLKSIHTWHLSWEACTNKDWLDPLIHKQTVPKIINTYWKGLLGIKLTSMWQTQNYKLKFLLSVFIIWCIKWM